MTLSPLSSARPLRLGMALAATAAAIALALSGCSSASSSSSSDNAAAPAEGFPVTIEHVYGKTTIDQQPERVVTLGWGSQDAVAALGVVPVGITDSTWGTVNTYLPWFADKVKELGGDLPEIVALGDSGEYDYEAILTLEPDVIIARHSGITEEEYQRLTEIAPTIAYADKAWESDWQDVQTIVGEALGKADEAKKIIADTDTAIADAAAEHPEFADTTFAYGWAWVDGDPGIGIYTTGDARERLIEQLGFEPSPTVVERSKDAKEFYFDTSLEEVDKIDADVYIAWANTEDEWTAMQANPLLKSWTPIADGKSYVMTTQELAWASSAPSALGIPYLLKNLVPELAAVVND